MLACWLAVATSQRHSLHNTAIVSRMSADFIDELFNKVFEPTARTGPSADGSSSNNTAAVPILTTLSLSRLRSRTSIHSTNNQLPNSQIRKLELLLQHDTSREEAISLLLEFPMLLSKRSYQVHSHVDAMTNKRRRVNVESTESTTPTPLSSPSHGSAVIPRPFIPFDASDRWACLQRFYANQKMKAWDDGMIPRLATNPNPPNTYLKITLNSSPTNFCLDLTMMTGFAVKLAPTHLSPPCMWI